MFKDSDMFCKKCGHPHHNHVKDGCAWRKHGGLLTCYCSGYVESKEEKKKPEDGEKKIRWPHDAIRVIKVLRKRLHTTHLHDETASAEPENCAGFLFLRLLSK